MTQIERKRDADRLRRLMIVGNGPQCPTDLGVLEKKGEGGDQRACNGGGDEVELVDEHPADDQRRLRDADVERMHIAAPDELAKTVEEKGQADRSHKQDDRLLIDERAQHQALDSDREQDHYCSGDDEGAPDRHAAFEQPDEGQRGKQHHRALGEVEHARGLEDQHKAQCHQRVHDAGEQPADHDLQHELRVARHIGERRQEKSLQKVHRDQTPARGSPR